MKVIPGSIYDYHSTSVSTCFGHFIIYFVNLKSKRIYWAYLERPLQIQIYKGTLTQFFKKGSIQYFLIANSC